MAAKQNKGVEIHFSSLKYSEVIKITQEEQDFDCSLLYFASYWTKQPLSDEPSEEW